MHMNKHVGPKPECKGVKQSEAVGVPVNSDGSNPWDKDRSAAWNREKQRVLCEGRGMCFNSSWDGPWCFKPSSTGSLTEAKDGNGDTKGNSSRLNHGVPYRKGSTGAWKGHLQASIVISMALQKKGRLHESARVLVHALRFNASRDDVLLRLGAVYQVNL